LQEIRESKSVVKYRRVPLDIGWVVVKIVVNDLPVAKLPAGFALRYSVSGYS
jgi:hypothetical protein